MAEAEVKVWFTASPLQRCPLQQEPSRLMFVQGLEVPMMVQEGRWQVLMYTGTEKLPGGGAVRKGSESREAAQRPGHRLLRLTSIAPAPWSRAMPPPSDQSHPFLLPGKPCLLPPPPLSDPARPPCQACPAYTPPAQALPPSQSVPYPRPSGHCPGSRRFGPGDTGPVGTSPGCSPPGGSPRRRSTRCR